MIRKLTAALIGVGVMVPGLANALGLGGIDLDSALSEPLDAKIELVQVRELRPEEILVNLASAADFKNAGVERFHSLTDVKFEVVMTPDGKSHIKLRTRKPIREPFLNFLVEVNWPAGRLLREYTLLLDPPVFQAAKEDPILKAPSVPAPQVAPVPVPAPRVETPTPVVSAPAPTPVPTAETADRTSDSAQDSTEGRSYGPTKSSDSLWAIARQLRPSSSVSIQQTMVAIQRLNPDAFINGNINLLRKGQVLRGPSENEVRELTSREAIAQVAQQNREWKDKVSKKESRVAEAPQIDTSGRAVENISPEPVTTGAHLKLVSGTESADSSSGQGGEGGANVAELRGELQVAGEQIDQFRLESEDLKVRNADLKEQLDTSDKVIGLKNEQIVALQAKLAEMEKEMQALKAQEAAAVSSEETAELIEPAAVAEEPVVESVEVASVAEEVVESEAASAEETTEPVDFNYEEAAQEEVQAEPTPEQAIVVEETVQTPVEPEVPVVKEQPKQDDFLTTLMSNPIYIAAGGGLLLILIVGAMLAGRKKKEEDDLADSLVDDFSLDGIGGADVEDTVEAVEEPISDVFAEEETVDEATVPQTADVIGEADIYIAYGRFPQAIEMLEKAAENEPDRADIRSKLLEVAVEAGDVAVFKRHDSVLQEVGNHDHLARAAELRSKLSIEDDVGEETAIMPAEDLGEDVTLDLASEETAESTEDFGSMDFDMDLSIDEEETKEAPAAEESIEVGQPKVDATTEEAEVTAEEISLDFDLDFSEEEAEAAPEEAEGLDLPEVDAAIEASEEIASEDDAGLDFSLDDEVLELDAGLDLDVDLEESEEELSFDADLDIDVEPISDFTEADESLDVDLGIEESLDEGVVESAEDSLASVADDSVDSMEFDLDVDAELDLPATPPETTEASDEIEIDSSAAAQLADELDLDGDFDLEGDFDLDVEEETSIPVEDDDDTLVMPHIAEKEAEKEIEAEASAEEEPDDATVVVPPVAKAIPEAANEDSAEEMDFLTDADEISTKLDLARAYIDMGDRDGAKDILDEVMIEGSNDQQGDAKELLAKLG